MSAVDTGGRLVPSSMRASTARWCSRTSVDRCWIAARDYLQDYSDRCQCVEVDLRDPDWTRIVGANFDAVVSAIAIHNLRDPAVIARIYADIVRILRPGGCHVEIDHLRSGELADRRRLLRLAGFDSTTVTVEAVDNDHALVKGCSP